MAYADTITIAPNIASQWGKQFFRYGLKNSYFGRFLGSADPIAHKGKTPKEVTISTDANALIQLRMEMTKERGDGINFPMIRPLTGRGIVQLLDGTTAPMLEGREEGVLAYGYKSILKEVGHAVRDVGPLSRQIAEYDLDSVSRMALGMWWGRALDKMTYAALAGITYRGDLVTPAEVPPTGSIFRSAVAPHAATRKLVGGMKAGTYTARLLDANLDDEEYMCLEIITDARIKAVANEPTIRPLMHNGEPWYLMFMHPHQVRDLKNNAGVGTGATWADAQKYAKERGANNPLFTGAIGAWDGVILFEYPGCMKASGVTGDVEELHEIGTEPNAFDTGDVITEAVFDDNGGADWGVTCGAYRAVFCGACAAVHAYGSMPKFVGKDFDYGRQHGLSVQALLSVDNPVFNSIQYGTIVVDTAAKGG